MIKIFLVEDEHIIRENVRKMVPWQEYGFEFAGEASDGEMALPKIRQVRPDIVITDIKMPFMDGLTLSRILKKEMPQIKIILLSGYDDFAYAQQAIAIGVDQYLLKPISREKFIDTLKETQEKNYYYEKYQKERQEYERHSRQQFFEELVSGNGNLEQVFENAERLKIDLMASAYNLVLFTLNHANEMETVENYSQQSAEILEEVEQYFSDTQNGMLFRNHMFCYAVLLQGNEQDIQDKTRRCVEDLTDIFEHGGKHLEWYICQGEAVKRISHLKDCYRKANGRFVLRYLKEEKDEPLELSAINPSSLDPQIIYHFLLNGQQTDVRPFLENYLQKIGEEALQSFMFRQYIMLNTKIQILSFLQRLGYAKEESEPWVDQKEEPADTIALQEILEQAMQQAIYLRDEASKKKYRGILAKAIPYIEENYMDDELSLNTMAKVVNVSANHFSALFSQEMEKTFVEYLTEVRMKKAKELLRCTEKRSKEIALEVGYKDSHYFSYLFKKTQGCTPSDYRNRREA